MAATSELQKEQYIPLRDGSDSDSLEDAPGCDTDTLLQQSEQRVRKNTPILQVLTGIMLVLNLVLLIGLFFVIKHPEVVMSDKKCARQLSTKGI